MPDEETKQHYTIEARAFLRSGRFGVLSTNGTDPAGYPFGSVTPYSLDEMNRPIILISSIAAHTRNIQADERVSLIVLDPAAPDTQAAPRLTLLGNARPVQGESIAERHGRFFPASRSYHQTHDFAYYRIEPVRARWIGGFGRIGWIGATDIQQPNPFFGESETGILDHMNADHRDALLKYARKGDDCEIAMIGIDAGGFDLLVDGRALRIEFPQAVHTPQEARAALIALAKA